MTQKSLNKEITEYISRRTESDSKVDVERIRKEAPVQSVSEAHPDLEEGKIHIIQKDDPWLKKIMKGMNKVQTVSDDEFTKEEERIKAASKKRSWSSILFGSDDDIPKPHEFEDEMDKIEKKEEELHEEEQTAEVIKEEKELGKRKSKTIWGFIGRFRGKEEVDESGREETASLQEDMKSIAKITTNVMKKLAPEELSTLKRSAEFEQFKEILKRRNLIKEKND